MKTFQKVVLMGVCSLAFAATAAMAADGSALYGTKCKTCHGVDGKGNPGLAKALKVEFKPVGGYTDAEIKTAVTAGFGKMKPVAGVAGADLDAVVAFVKTLK